MQLIANQFNPGKHVCSNRVTYKTRKNKTPRADQQGRGVWVVWTGTEGGHRRHRDRPRTLKLLEPSALKRQFGFERNEDDQIQTVIHAPGYGLCYKHIFSGPPYKIKPTYLHPTIRKYACNERQSYTGLGVFGHL